MKNSPIPQLKAYALFGLLFLFSFSLLAQVGIGTTDPDPNAKLDITSTAEEPGGLLLPRVALSATNSASPLSGPITNGMVVYNTATAGTGLLRVTPGFYYHESGKWVRLASAAMASDNWTLTGNAGTTAGTNFLGTTDNIALQFKTNGFSRFEISNGNQANGGSLRAFTNGTAAAPIYSWNTNSNTGMYQAAANILSFSTGGKERFRIPNSYQVLAMDNGTAASPFYSWSSGVNMGMYRGGTNILSFSTASVERMNILADGRIAVNSATAFPFMFNSFATGTNGAIIGSSVNAAAVQGQASGSGNGVAGVATSGTGVLGQSTIANAQGGFFMNTQPNGFGLLALGGGNSYVAIPNTGTGAAITGRLYGTTSFATGNNGIGVVGVGEFGALFESTNNAGYTIVRNTATSGAFRNGLLVAGQNLGIISLPETGAIFSGNIAAGAGFAANTNGTGIVGAGNNITNVWLAENGSGVAGTGLRVGVYGKADQESAGIGVVGLGNGLSTYVVPGTDGAGVAGTGIHVGVYGHATDAGGFGVYSSGNLKVDGDITANGFALVGGSLSLTGAITGTSLSVSGDLNSGGVINSVGNINAGGDLNSGGIKHFIIDDPRDPANKYLMHASIESNEILNLYRGVSTFDASGEAVVQLPDYYDAINKNASYQLTPIGTSMPNLYIATEVNNGVFKIGGGVASKKVSWILTAERNDPYIRSNPETRNMVVDKGVDRGRYLAPEAYGQPIDQGILNNRVREAQIASTPAIAKRVVTAHEMQSQSAEATRLNTEQVQSSTTPLKNTPIESSALQVLRDVPLKKAPEIEVFSTTEVFEEQSSSGSGVNIVEAPPQPESIQISTNPSESQKNK